MSKRESLLRYSIIINLLRKRPCSLKEILDKLAFESEIHGYNFEISGRTFLRDRDDIRSMYNIDIQYDFSLKKYRIMEDEADDTNMRMLEAFDTFNALNTGEKLLRHIQLEKRRPLGTEHIHGLLHAIRNRHKVRFAYKKYWDENTQLREIEPYLLKEFRQRWYVVGLCDKHGKIRIFGLDRMGMLDIRMEKFTYPKDFKAEAYFRDCFGIIGPNDQPAEDIILSFKPHQGKYIKSLPLHESQEILKDNDNELRIKLHLRPTYDFRMEILSYGESVKVIQPKSFRQEVIHIYRKALDRYE
ncbi:MAG: helix-turn-helix transcriptional regulator [Bacteroidales bacterium]